MGVHATALWLMGRHAALPEVAASLHEVSGTLVRCVMQS